MQPEGLLATPWCVVAYNDAGKDCTSGSDCEGDCRIFEMADLGADGKVHGVCQPNNVPYGCYAQIEDGKIVGGGLLCVE